MLWTLRNLWEFREFLGISEEGEMGKCLISVRYTFLCAFLTTPLAPITYVWRGLLNSCLQPRYFLELFPPPCHFLG